MIGSRALAFVAVCVAAFGLSACGSSSSTSSNSTESTTAAAGGAGESAPATAGKEATGKPLKILVTSFVNAPLGNVPEIWAGAEVAAENINKEGGINGRPIEVVPCNGKNDPKAEVACARKGVSEGVIAGDGNVFQTNPEGSYEVLNRAGIADIAGFGGSPALFTLPNEYPIGFIAATANGCLAPQTLESAGSGTKIGVVYAQNPFGEGVYSLMEPLLKSPQMGSKWAGSIGVPDSEQDFSSVVQELDEKGANMVQLDVTPTPAAQIVTTAASSGKKWSFCADGGLIGPQALEELGSLTESFFTSSVVPPISSGEKYPLVKQFVEEMTAAKEAGKEDANIELNPINPMTAWMGMQIIKQVADGIKGEVTAKSFWDAMKTAKVNLGYAKFDFAKPLGTAPFERVFQPTGFITKWNNSTKELDEVAQVNLLEPLG